MDNVKTFHRREDIRKEANAWVLRINDDSAVSDDDIQALREWVSRSPAHRTELEKAEAFWRDADLLSVLSVPTRSKALPIKRFLSSITDSMNRPWIGGTAAASLLIVLTAFWYVQDYLPTKNTVGNGEYYTMKGEQKMLTLKDQSLLHLDTNSRVKVEYNDKTRLITLVSGKAYFNVAKNPDKPFEVHTGQGVVRAVGTAFSVYIDPKGVEVTVNEGRVNLARKKHLMVGRTLGNAGNTIAQSSSVEEAVFLSLDRGQSVLFDQSTEIIVDLVDKELSKELAWREGLLIFTGEPLEEVISEVNRYTETRIEIMDPAVGDLLMGGRFRVGELKALFGVLESGFDIQVSYIDEKYVQLSARSEK